MSIIGYATGKYNKICRRKINQKRTIFLLTINRKKIIIILSKDNNRVRGEMRGRKFGDIRKII